MAQTQDGFLPRGLFPRIRAVLVAMADSPLRKVEVREKSAGTAFISAVIVNSLDVAKTRLQAQEAGVSYQPACTTEGLGSFKAQIDPRTRKLPGVLAVLRSVKNMLGVDGGQLQGIRVMWTGVRAQLARDVPFSAICWSVVEPARSFVLEKTAGSDPDIGRVLGANFVAGMFAGGLAAAATCPLDVIKTWRQIEKDPAKVMSMALRRILVKI